MSSKHFIGDDHDGVFNSASDVYSLVQIDALADKDFTVAE